MAEPEKIPWSHAPAVPPLTSLMIIASMALVLLLVVPRPGQLSDQGWHLMVIFLCTVLALMLRPIPGGAAVLIGLILTILSGVYSVPEALAAYGGGTAWLVLAAFFIARALIGRGLARRIALYFVRRLGHTSMGIAYALGASDLILAGIIPSNAARVGGVILPVTRSLVAVYKSLPGPTAALLGTYLMLSIYQVDVIACAMHFTGQASNPIAARLAEQTAQVRITWSSWLYTALVPGLAAFVVAPWVIFRLSPPEIRHTPQAAEMARVELEKMGPMSRAEKIVLAVFILVCGLWSTSWLHPLDTTAVALLGVGVLLVTGALTWRDAMQEHAAWDIFVWYGGLIRLGEGLNEFGVTTVFAGWTSAQFPGWHWPALAVVILLIYFYSHYAFASLTTHFLSMYVPFLGILLAAGAPPPLMAYSMAFYTNLSASLTHYGTTQAPMVFSAGYVSHGLWWKVGLVMSFVNLFIWTSLGLVWWKFLGLW